MTPFDDALEAVAELRARGAALAVASSSEHDRLRRTLACTGHPDAFDVIVAGDEVARGKPAPEIFLTAADRLGVEPRDCIVVEDSPPGVAAGLAAGMVTIAVCRAPGAAGSLASADRVLEILTADAILAAPGEWRARAARPARRTRRRASARVETPAARP